MSMRLSLGSFPERGFFFSLSRRPETRFGREVYGEKNAEEKR